MFILLTVPTTGGADSANACGPELIVLMSDPSSWGPHEMRSWSVTHSADLPGKPLKDREATETILRWVAPDRIQTTWISHGERTEVIVNGRDTWWRPHGAAWSKVDDKHKRDAAVNRDDHLAKHAVDLICRRERRTDGSTVMEYAGEIKEGFSFSMSGTLVFDEIGKRPLRDDLVLAAQGWPVRLNYSAEFSYSMPLDIQPPADLTKPVEPRR